MSNLNKVAPPSLQASLGRAIIEFRNILAHGLGEPDHVDVATVVVEEVHHCAPEQRAAVEPAALALELRKAEHSNRLVDMALFAQPMKSAIDVATPALVRTALDSSST